MAKAGSRRMLASPTSPDIGLKITSTGHQRVHTGSAVVHGPVFLLLCTGTAFLLSAGNFHRRRHGRLFCLTYEYGNPIQQGRPHTLVTRCIGALHVVLLPGRFVKTRGEIAAMVAWQFVAGGLVGCPRYCNLGHSRLVTTCL